MPSTLLILRLWPRSPSPRHSRPVAVGPYFQCASLRWGYIAWGPRTFPAVAFRSSSAGRDPAASACRAQYNALLPGCPAAGGLMHPNAACACFGHLGIELWTRQPPRLPLGESDRVPTFFTRTSSGGARRPDPTSINYRLRPVRNRFPSYLAGFIPDRLIFFFFVCSACSC